MKKEKFIKAVNGKIVTVENSIAALKKKKTANTITEEAAAEIDQAIADKEAEIEFLKQIKADAEAAEDDESETMLQKLQELQAKVKQLEDEKKAEETENRLKGAKSAKVQNFLNSKRGRVAFMNAVKNSANAEEFRANWGDTLTKNGITPLDAMLPPAVVATIKDGWEKAADGFLNLLNITGLKVVKTLFENRLEDADTSRAGGHKKGQEKSEQLLNFVPKEIRPQIVYKYITIDRETELEDENGVLANYIARELVERLMHEIMRSVLIGDDRTAGDPRKISKLEAIDRAATDNYVTVSTAAAALATMEEVAAAVDAIEADGEIVLFMSKAQRRALQRFVAATGGTVQYRPVEDICDELGVSEIRTTRLLAAATRPAVIAFCGKSYDVVGDLTVNGFEDFILAYNTKEYLTEIYIGGGLSDFKSGAVVKKVTP